MSLSMMTTGNFLNRQGILPAFRDVLRLEPESRLGFRLFLPYSQLSIFARSITTSAALARVPIYAIAEIGLGPEEPLPGEAFEEGEVEALRQKVKLQYPLGLLGTDHAGYASFDLTMLRSAMTLGQVRALLEQHHLLADHEGDREPVIRLTRLQVLPFSDPTIAFDALVEGDLGPDFISLRLDFDDFMLAGRLLDRPSASMQNPNILDWRLSPGSFSMSGALLIGEQGCETLLPANLATQLFRFMQIIRTPHRKTVTLGENSQTYALGYAVEYRTEWFSIGHSLGQIMYSLPLAPGEKVKIAVVDWDRQDTVRRDEKTDLQEQLYHDQLRERNLSEAVQMVVREWQSGSSFMAGTAASAGAGIPLGASSLGVGGALSLGGASTSSEGTRTVAGDTAQRITDAFHQASTALRELRSTVVIQGRQAEQVNAQTRVVANYNHSHALTMLYYEVLHHYRLITRPAARQPVLLIQQPTGDFTHDLILQHRRVLEQVLLDPRLKPCIEVVNKRQCLQTNLQRAKRKKDLAGDPLDDHELGTITFRVRSGAVGPTLNAFINIIPKAGGTPIPCRFTDPALLPTDFSSGQPVPYPWAIENFGSRRIKPNEEFIAECKPEHKVRWNNVTAIELGQTRAPAHHLDFDHAHPEDWVIQDLRITTAHGGDKWVMFSSTPPTPRVPWNGAIRVDVKAYQAVIESVDDLLTDEERCCIDDLQTHLNANKLYYYKAIWLAEDKDQRAMRLEELTLKDKPVLDLVENRLLEIVGSSLAFPIAPGAARFISGFFNTRLEQDDAFGSEYIEQLLTLPTRGVFAEAKLGHCNASEEIDTTRFWDWQQSPIPDNPPEITGVDAGPRVQQPAGLTPTPFPGSLLNIVNPPALPDPTGLSGAFGLAAALGPFRDMSGSRELGALLQTLSNNATQLASQGLEAQSTKQMMDLIRSAKELSPEQRTELIDALLTGSIKPPAQPVAQREEGKNTVDGEGTPQTGEQNSQAEPPTTPPVTSKPTKPQVTAKPGVVIPQKTSGKTRLLVFDFAYDTHEPMLGEWTVILTAPNESADKGRLIDTVRGASGSKSGDRVEMAVDSGFGGTADIKVQIEGRPSVAPDSIDTGQTIFRAARTDRILRATKTISRAVFDKTQTYAVTQPTDEVEFKITLKKEEGSESVTTDGSEKGVKVGLENTFEAGGNVGVIEGKDTVKVTAEGTYTWSQSESHSKTLTNGTETTVEFKGRKLSSAQPDITPVS